MATQESVSVRSFADRAEALSQFILRAGEAPRFLAFDDVAGCPADTALAALEWTGVVGILLDGKNLDAFDLTGLNGAWVITDKGELHAPNGSPTIYTKQRQLHAARLTAETAAALVERRTPEGRRFVYLGPRLDAAPMDIFEGRVLFEEPGVKAIEFAQRSHALAHFFRSTSGDGALVSMLGRRAPELRHIRRWFGPILRHLEGASQLLGGWYASSAGGALFVNGLPDDPVYRYIEVGLES